jgi:hypothetical protein
MPRMSCSLLLVCVGLVARGLSPGIQAAQTAPATHPEVTSAPMSNADVVTMVAGKVSDGVILTAIHNATASAFDVTSKGLVNLKSSGVKDKIVVAIQKAAADKQAAGSPRPALTNADIVAMVAGKLSTDVIVAAINTASTTAFDVSPTGLVDLKAGGVSERVTQTMQRRSRSAKSPTR